MDSIKELSDNSEFIIMFQILSDRKKIVYGTINYKKKILYKRYIPYLHYGDVLSIEPLSTPWEKPNPNHPIINGKYSTYDLPNFKRSLEYSHTNIAKKFHDDTPPKPDEIFLQTDLVVSMEHIPYYIPLMILNLEEEDFGVPLHFDKKLHAQIYTTFHELKPGKYKPLPPPPPPTAQMLLSPPVACPRCSTHLQPPPGIPIFACPCGQHIQGPTATIPMGTPVKKYRLSRKHTKRRR